MKKYVIAARYLEGSISPLGCARFPDFVNNSCERQILWSLCSVDFQTLTLQLPIQTPHSVAPELQVFVSSLQNCQNFSKTSTPLAGCRTFRSAMIASIVDLLTLPLSAASREFTGSMGLLSFNPQLKFTHRKLQQFATFEILIYVHKMTTQYTKSLTRMAVNLKSVSFK